MFSNESVVVCILYSCLAFWLNNPSLAFLRTELRRCRLNSRRCAAVCHGPGPFPGPAVHNQTRILRGSGNPVSCRPDRARPDHSGKTQGIPERAHPILPATRGLAETQRDNYPADLISEIFTIAGASRRGLRGKRAGPLPGAAQNLVLRQAKTRTCFNPGPRLGPDHRAKQPKGCKDFPSQKTGPTSNAKPRRPPRAPITDRGAQMHPALPGPGRRDGTAKAVRYAMR